MQKLEVLQLLVNGLRQNENGCWEWAKAVEQKVYGQLRINEKRRGTHRVAWRLFKGKIPKGKLVCHKCDNPPCCNPSHLFLGTHGDNARDRSAKGRGGFGERNGNAKITDEQAYEIRRRYEGKYGQIKQLAEEFGISSDGIRRIIRGDYRMRGIEEITWETRYKPKMTEDKVREMRTRYATGKETYASLAKEFGVDKTQVMNIVRRLQWKNVD